MCSKAAAGQVRNYSFVTVDVAQSGENPKDQGEKHDENPKNQGEKHVFCFDANIFELVKSLTLKPPEDKKFHRAPAICEFKIKPESRLKESRLKEAHLIVVSVHLKSGGGDETKEEVKKLAGGL